MYLVKNYLDKHCNIKRINLEILRKIGTYIRNNIDIMIGDGYTKRIIFGADLRSDFINTYNIDTVEFLKMLKTSEYIYGENGKNILNILLLYSAKFAKGKERNTILEFLAIIMYSSLYVKYFQYGVYKENIMIYTLDHAPLSFDIKRYGTLSGVIESTIKTYLTRFDKELEKFDDKSVNDMLGSLRTRINDKIKNVAILYNRNIDSGVGGTYTDSENLDKEALQLTQSENIKFSQLIDRVSHSELEKGVDITLLRYAGASKYREIIDTLAQSDIDIIVKELVDEYYKNIDNPSYIRMQKEFLRYSFTNRKRSPILIKLIQGLAKSNNVSNKRDFETTFRKYFILKIHDVLVKEA